MPSCFGSCSCFGLSVLEGFGSSCFRGSFGSDLGSTMPSRSGSRSRRTGRWCWRGSRLRNCCKHWRSGVPCGSRNGWIATRGEERDEAEIIRDCIAVCECRERHSPGAPALCARSHVPATGFGRLPLQLMPHSGTSLTEGSLALRLPCESVKYERA